MYLSDCGVYFTSFVGLVVCYLLSNIGNSFNVVKVKLSAYEKELKIHAQSSRLVQLRLAICVE